MIPRTNLPGLMAVSAVLSVLVGWCGTAMGWQDRLFVGTYTTGDSVSQGIYTTVLDRSTGALSPPELAAESVNPSFLAVHPTQPWLFAVNEVSEGGGRGNGQVSAFRIGDNGRLTLINQQPSLGGAPCHCNVDATGRYLLVANYVGGNIVVFPIAADGALGAPSANRQHAGSSVDRSRQEAPHAHSINLSADNRFAYAADLGTDRIQIYRFDAAQGTLEPTAPDAVSVTAGGGPRHFSLHPGGQLAFANNELTATVTAFRRDPETGSLEAFQEISTVPEGYAGRRSTAECVVHPSGRFLYVSNRGHDSIAVFAIDQMTGRLNSVAITQTGGREPRNFFVHPQGHWLMAENQNSDSIVVFAINQNTGAITPTSHRIQVGRPVCIRLQPAQQPAR